MRSLHSFQTSPPCVVGLIETTGSVQQVPLIVITLNLGCAAYGGQEKQHMQQTAPIGRGSRTEKVPGRRCVVAVGLR